jgi:hypothetical protein
MKWWIVTLVVFQTVLFAGPQKLMTDSEGVTHFKEILPTPEPVKENVRKELRLRSLVRPYQPKGGTEGLGQEIDQVGVILDKITNLGKKVWAVIEQGRPMVNINYHYANALPAGVRAEELEGFSSLQFQSVRHTGVNFYGVTVYDVTYTLAHRFGGQFDGTGAYIEGATVLPQDVEVLWGYNVNLSVESVSTVNVGTRDNPVASLAMETLLSVRTVLQDIQMRNIHEFRGDTAEINSTETLR